MKSFVAVTIVLLQITGFYCYGTGAPAGACGTMEPGHKDITAQTEPTPYTITASATSYSPNQEITVTITGGTTAHGGLLVQARKSDDSSTTPIGTFKTPSANTKLTKCTADADSWTHNAPTAKTISTVKWMAPADAGTVVFKATVATDKATYWLNHKSGELTYNSSTKTIVSCLLIIMCLLGLKL